MLIGETWVLDHLRAKKKSGHTMVGKNWTNRVRQEQSHIIARCDRCGQDEDVSDIPQMRLLVHRCQMNEVKFGMHLCADCAHKEASDRAQVTRNAPGWHTWNKSRPSWQSQADPDKIAAWRASVDQGVTATKANWTSEQRRQGVVKQWQTMTTEVKATRAARIGAAGKQIWTNYTEEERATRIKNMVKGLPRSGISDRFKQALIDAGLYAGFASEVSVAGFVVDEADLDRKLILEFFGDYYHCNPRKYTDPQFYNRTIHMTAEQRWLYDRRRLAAFHKKGFEILIVWEDAWKKNPAGELQRVQAFLQGGVL